MKEQEAAGLQTEQHGSPEQPAERATAQEPPEQAHYRALDLGLLLAQHGELEEAIAAFQQAVDFGDAQVEAPAALNLGELLARHGRVAETMVAYQRAIDCGHAAWLEPAKEGLRALRSHGYPRRPS